MHRERLAIVILACAAAILGGCDEDEAIRTYRAPKPEAMDPRGDFDDRPAVTRASQPADSGGPLALRYAVPDSWREKPAERKRIAAFDVLADGNAATEVTVVFLRMDLDVHSNINRWLGQIGREPVDPNRAAELVTAGPLEQPTTSRRVVLHGERRSIAVAMLQRGGGWWFIKMTGKRPVVEAQTTTLWEFVRSIEFKSADTESPSANGAVPPPAGTPGMLDPEVGDDE